LPKKFAEKIESKFSVARRERRSAAGCVTESGTTLRGSVADLDPPSERSEPVANPKKQSVVRQRLLANGLTSTSQLSGRISLPGCGDSAAGRSIQQTYPRLGHPFFLPFLNKLAPEFIQALVDRNEEKAVDYQSDP